MPDRITAADISPAMKRAIAVSSAACGLLALLLGPAFALVAPAAIVNACLVAAAGKTALHPR